MTPSTPARFCANCGAPREGDAAFCANCGVSLSGQGGAVVMPTAEDVSETLRQLRAAIGDRYAVERELGRGGMATVFLARDLKHDREVAIKVLHPELSASIGADRFEREIRLAAKLQHPHILGLYDSGDANGLLYYVMPFVRGESLRDKLDREGMLPVDEALRITLEVSSALGYAHEQGIVHRDIKPENILLSGDHALVADFGIARAANDASGQKLTQTGMAVGTPVYMAPEQSTGDPVGPAADIYSLGCMLYEMLAGEPPFTGANAMAIMAKHLMEQVPSVRVVRSAVPEQVEEAIFHAMAKTAVDRPKTAQAFAEMLGMSLQSTAALRAMRASSTMRGSQVMRGSQMMRGTAMVPRQTVAGSVFKVDEFGELVEVAPTVWWKRPLTWAAAAVVLAAGGLGAWMSAGRGPQTVDDPDLRRIAVLYFDTPDTTLRAAADGITEGLIRSLSRISAITTISASGAESVRGMTSTDSIVDRLRVGFLVRGAVQPEGQRVAVSFRLLTRNGSPAGDGRLTVARDSLLLAQDSIATIAADLIRNNLGNEIQLRTQQSATSSNVAWLAVQDGLALQRRFQAQAVRDTAGAWALFAQADSAFARAEAADPRWNEPVVRRAVLAYLRSRMYGRDPARIRPWVTASIEQASRALQRNADDADALEARGTARVFSFLQQVPPEAERLAELDRAVADLERATTINQRQAGAWTSLSAAYYSKPGTTLDQVMIAAQNALAADEFQSNAVITRGRLVNAAYDLGLFDKADQACGDLERRHPGNERAIRCRLYLQSIPDRPSYDIARAWRLTDSLVAAGPARLAEFNRHVGEIFTAATIARASRLPGAPAGLADSARAVARRGEGDAMVDPTGELRMYAAYLSMILDDRDEAFRRLNSYIAVSPEDRRASMRTNPTWWFRPLESDPRWGQLVGRP